MNLKFGVLSAAILFAGLATCLGGLHDASSQRPLLESIAAVLRDGGFPVLALTLVGFAAQYLSLTGLAVLLRPLGRVLLYFVSGLRRRDGAQPRG